jgi:hypothetical protein
MGGQHSGCARRRGGWVKRLRAAAAILTILAALPTAAGTLSLLFRVWIESAPEPPPGEQKHLRDQIRLGPGKCPPFHYWKNGKCVDVRR